MATIHKLAVSKRRYEAILKSKRNYHVVKTHIEGEYIEGDVLILREHELNELTGRELSKVIGYVEYLSPSNFAILGFQIKIL